MNQSSTEGSGSNGNAQSGRVLASVIWVWGAGLAATALTIAVLASTHWLYSFWTDFGGAHLNFAVYVAHGENYFTRQNTYPMLAPEFPGLFSLLLVPWVYAFGPKLLYGNILGVLCFVVTLTTAAAAAKTYSGRYLSIPFAWGLLLSMRRVGEAYAWNRPDSLAVALVGVSLVCLLHSEKRWAAGRTNSIFLALAASTATLACFSKQTAVCMAAGTCLYFLIARAIRQLIEYVIVSLLVGIPIVLIAQRLTDGGFLYDIVTLIGGIASFSGSHWLQGSALFSLGSAGALFFGAIGVYSLLRRGVIRGPLLCLAVVTCVLVFFAYATCWHEGAGAFYFVFATFGLAITGGIAAADWFGNPSRSPRALYSCFLLLTVGHIAFNHLTPWRTLKEMWPAPWAIRRPDLTKSERLFERTRHLEGEVLFERFHGMPVLQGRRVEVEPVNLVILKRNKLWDQTVFLNDLKRQRWSYIVTLNPYGPSSSVFLDDELDAVFREGYRCIEDFPLETAGAWVQPVAHLCRARTD